MRTRIFFLLVLAVVTGSIGQTNQALLGRFISGTGTNLGANSFVIALSQEERLVRLAASGTLVVKPNNSRGRKFATALAQDLIQDSQKDLFG